MRRERAGPRWTANARRLRACCLIGALLLGAARAPAQTQTQDAVALPEENVKAAFIFNFAVFTEWPAAALAAGAPLLLCTYPGNSLHTALASLNDKVVNGHPLQVRQLNAAARLRGCHILVLGNGDRERWGLAKKELADASTLTVTDERSIGDDGVVITLGLENRRIGFDVVLGTARQARLVLSSKLLRLARSVQ